MLKELEDRDRSQLLEELELLKLMLDTQGEKHQALSQQQQLDMERLKDELNEEKGRRDEITHEKETGEEMEQLRHQIVEQLDELEKHQAVNQSLREKIGDLESRLELSERGVQERAHGEEQVRVEQERRMSVLTVELQSHQEEFAKMG